MGEYANMHANDMFEQHLDSTLSIHDGVEQTVKDGVPLNSLPYDDIKRRTAKAILIKLAIQVAPLNMEHYDVDYMWLPIKHIRLDEKNKRVAIVQWLLERKIDEQCSAIASKLITPTNK